ncbi:MAG: hypothetical protein ACK5KR_02700 [Breznakia sp.]
MIEKLNAYLKEVDGTLQLKQQSFYDEIRNYYIQEEIRAYGNLTTKEAIGRLKSVINFNERSRYKSCEDLGVWIRIGDICFIDYGPNYINEAGFQHFGLILSIENAKVLVIPMTSNPKTHQEALQGRKHLFALGQIIGMHRNSTLFLNDAKFVNSARIIDVKANIPKQSKLFKKIKKKFYVLLD